MSQYKEIINSLKPVAYSKYKEITSNEKLMAYTALILEEKWVPLTFNYLCIAAFKLFPWKFCCDEEFREFPSVDRLNRTMMHMKYQQWKPSYLAWSIKTWYSITNLWRQNALMTKNIIDSTKDTGEAEQITTDKHKEWSWKYKQLLEDPWFKEYVKTWKFDEIAIYDFFEVTPFTQIDYIKKTLTAWLEYAESKENGNEKCSEYIKIFLSRHN